MRRCCHGGFLLLAACASGQGSENSGADARTGDAQSGADAGCVALDLLGNGDFEDGSVAWSQSSSLIRSSGQLPFAPHDGSAAAMLGVTNNANDILSQTVTVPDNASRLRLSGYECHVTTETLANVDSFVIDLVGASDSVLENLVALSNDDVASTCSWTPFERVSLDAYANTEVTLRLTAQTNDTALTRFVVDSLAFEALVCP